MKKNVWVWGVLFMVIAFCFSGCGILKSLNATYANYRGEVDANYMVQDAHNRILSYDWYYDQFAQIQAQIANIEAIDKSDGTRDGMIRVVNSMIGEYNSKSRQYNHNLWKAQDLPQSIEMYKGESE
jgi:hypothetical protein